MHKYGGYVPCLGIVKILFRAAYFLLKRMSKRRPHSENETTSRTHLWVFMPVKSGRWRCLRPVVPQKTILGYLCFTLFKHPIFKKELKSLARFPRLLSTFTPNHHKKPKQADQLPLSCHQTSALCQVSRDPAQAQHAWCI